MKQEETYTSDIESRGAILSTYGSSVNTGIKKIKAQDLCSMVVLMYSFSSSRTVVCTLLNKKARKLTSFVDHDDITQHFRLISSMFG